VAFGLYRDFGRSSSPSRARSRRGRHRRAPTRSAWRRPAATNFATVNRVASRGFLLVVHGRTVLRRHRGQARRAGRRCGPAGPTGHGRGSAAEAERAGSLCVAANALLPRWSFKWGGSFCGLSTAPVAVGGSFGLGRSSWRLLIIRRAKSAADAGCGGGSHPMTQRQRRNRSARSAGGGWIFGAPFFFFFFFRGGSNPRPDHPLDPTGNTCQRHFQLRWVDTMVSRSGGRLLRGHGLRWSSICVPGLRVVRFDRKDISRSRSAGPAGAVGGDVGRLPQPLLAEAARPVFGQVDEEVLTVVGRPQRTRRPVQLAGCGSRRRTPSPPRPPFRSAVGGESG